MTLNVHCVPEGTLAPQVVVTEKSPGFVPPIVLELMATALSPVVRVTVCGKLVAPTFKDSKTKPVGFKMIPFNMLTLDTKASQFPPEAACSGLVSGKSREQV
jgi:hypothetical protein